MFKNRYFGIKNVWSRLSGQSIERKTEKQQKKKIPYASVNKPCVKGGLQAVVITM